MTPAPSSPVALLDQLDELRAKATAGPWEPWTGSYGPVGADDPEGNIVLDYSTWVDNAHDAESARNLVALILAAVNALPELIAELRKRDAAVRAVLELADELDSKSPQATAWHVATRIRAALSVTP